MGKFGETRGGVGKSGVLEHKATISLKRVKIEESYYLGHELTNALSNNTIPDPLRRLRPPVPQDGVRNPYPKLQPLGWLGTVKLRTSNLASTFRGSLGLHPNKSPLKIGSVGVSHERGYELQILYAHSRDRSEQKSIKISGKVAVGIGLLRNSLKIYNYMYFQSKCVTFCKSV